MHLQASQNNFCHLFATTICQLPNTIGEIFRLDALFLYSLKFASLMRVLLFSFKT